MDKLIAYAPLLAEGTLVTISVALLSLALATLLGALGAAAKITGGRLSRAVAQSYTTIVRGVPDLVLILLIYFAGQRLVNDLGLGPLLQQVQIFFGNDEADDYFEISKFWAGVVSIGFIYGAYLTETFRGAYMSVPKGLGEASYALGMTRLQTLWTVTLPQLLRHALPGYGNVWMVLVKSTAVVSVIGLHDLVGLADKAGKATREPFLFFVAVILVYLAITAVSNWIFRRADLRVSRGQTT